MSEIGSNTSVETENLNVLSADNPLTDPKEDKLGYAPFAENLAKSICKMSPPDGLVMAVYAPWGSGKSTLLNFIIHYLEQKPEEEQPIIVPFNPWWFSGQKNLTKSFFDQLLGVLYEKWESWEKDFKKKISNWAERVSSVPHVFTKGLAAAANILIEPKDIHKLKKEIEEKLKEQNKRILIVIDDIDRLTAEEIRQLFRVIKAVANFHNVIYLLLFDKDVVVKALADIQKMDGEAYLEKIVQVPFELPLPDKYSLDRIFRAELNKIIADTPEELFQEDYWKDLDEGIAHFITTPRSICRLINTLVVTYSAVKGEVNFVDFIAIETLRLFCPIVYKIIRNNPNLFCGGLNTMSDTDQAFHNAWISQIQEKDTKAVKHILAEIFPRLRKFFGKRYSKQKALIPYHQEKKYKQLHICRVDTFTVYFRLAVPGGNISHTEFKAILSLTNNAEIFAEKLVELSQQTHPNRENRVKLLINRLEIHAEEITLNSVTSILQALFLVGDYLWHYINEFAQERLINQLLEQIQKSERSKVLLEAMLHGHAVATIVWQVISLGEQHGKYGNTKLKQEYEILVDTQQLEELEKLAVQKVREAAQKNELLKVPKLRPILSFWRDSVGVEEVKQWVQSIIQKDKDLVKLLENFLSKNRESYRLDPQSLAPYLEASEVIGQVRRLADDSDLTENQRIALKQFIKEYEMRERGENPNHPFP